MSLCGDENPYVYHFGFHLLETIAKSFWSDLTVEERQQFCDFALRLTVRLLLCYLFLCFKHSN
jgi:hypothetical protein